MKTKIYSLMKYLFLVLLYGLCIWLFLSSIGCASLKKIVSKSKQESKKSEVKSKDSVSVKIFDSIGVKKDGVVTSLKVDSNYDRLTIVEEQIDFGVDSIVKKIRRIITTK